MLFFLALILYITAVVLGLVCFVVAKKSFRFFKAGIMFHLLFFILMLISLIWKPAQENNLTIILSLSLLFLCCSGIILFGLIINEPGNIFFKTYFCIYVLSFPLFIIKPSALIQFLLYKNFENVEQENFVVKNNYFLERQNTTTIENSTSIPFKFVEKHGLFTKTLKRDVFFGFKPDSVKTLFFRLPDSIVIRGYGQVNNKSDSISVILKIKK